MGVTYVAQKRLRVGDGYREPGEKVPEAADWMNVSAYIDRGMIALVPDEGDDAMEVASQKGRHRYQGRGRQRLVPRRFAPGGEDATEDEVDEEPIEPTELDQEPESEEDEGYQDMSVDEVKQAYEDGLYTLDDIDEFEDQREEGRRKGIDTWLDSLEEDEDDEE